MNPDEVPWDIIAKKQIDALTEEKLKHLALDRYILEFHGKALFSALSDFFQHCKNIIIY
jgi:hypothetical protein